MHNQFPGRTHTHTHTGHLGHNDVIQHEEGGVGVLCVYPAAVDGPKRERERDRKIYITKPTTPLHYVVCALLSSLSLLLHDGTMGNKIR